MNRIFLFLCLVLTLVAGCGDNRDERAFPPDATTPLSSENLNLIFVVSPDLVYQGSGDVNPDTANLTNRGLQRSLLLAGYLKEEVLGGHNVTRIYTLEPMTHPQTEHDYPDMAAIWYVQQFALLNQITLDSYTADSYPLNASYTGAGRGLDFNNTADNNVTLATGVIQADNPGFYVFCAPWETIGVLLTGINSAQGYNLKIPTSYRGPDYVYAISIAPSGEVALAAYNADLNPPAGYPELPSPVAPAECGLQTPFNITRTGGVDGAVVPEGMNTNETVYMIRHAEAHPTDNWEDGNLVGTGQWRALALPGALKGKISPDRVYSIDPSLPIPGDIDYSYVRPSLTAEPYAIANNLPYGLATSADGIDFYGLSSFAATAKFFFTGGRFSNQTILLAWEHDHYPPTVNVLLAGYGGTGEMVPGDVWPADDYDTIWTVTLDAQGNLTVHNALCEGIDSASLPDAAPQF